MNNALVSFNEIIQHTQTSAGLFCYLQEQRIPIDASDLLRWEWVLAVSAFDKYIHDIVRIGMIEEFLGRRSETDKYKSFRITVPLYSMMLSSQSPELIFENEIIRQHGIQAFQTPEKVGDALSFIWTENHKWQVISGNMKNTITERDLKTKLNNIVIRRNQIVHEGDCIKSVFPLKQQTISESDAKDVIGFISELVAAIHLSVA